MAYNILVVDDSAIVRAVIGKTLRMAGVDVGQIFEAANGREALDRIEKEWVDIVFADINMPVMNGMEMVDELSLRGMLKDLPVVMVSTERSVTRIEDLKAKGVRAYLRKPFTPELIRDVVEKLLGNARPDAPGNAGVISGQE
jgi:two-component system chemotaxis response regulator CheY